MIHRIETGWVQINDALSKQERRQRRRPKKLGKPIRQEEPARTDVEEEEERASIDLMV